METGPLRPYFVVIALLIATSVALAVTVDVRVTNEAGIVVELPDVVGEWTGQEVRFCSNADCQKDFELSELEDPDVCPVCGSSLDCMSWAERALLPKDTIILKKRYMRSTGEAVFVSIVLSGKERASIHRPQVCLVGQGREIEETSVLEVPIDGRKSLKVTLLDMLQKGKSTDGRDVAIGQYYAYWFVGKGRETPYHTQRMVWMATDRIFHNVSHRWAYISVAGVRDVKNEEHREEVQEILHDLYPQMLRTDA